MGNFSTSKTGRIYLGIQTAFATAATLTGANACRHIDASLKANNPRTARPDKTGTLSKPPGMGGYRDGTVSVSMSTAGNGTAGHVPDCDPILQSWFGQAPTLTSGVSAVYTPVDAYVPITIGHYRLPSTVRQQIAWGAVFDTLTFNFNDGVANTWKASGMAGYVPDSMTCATLDSIGLAGISSSSFPTEPSSPVTNGSTITSFSGSLSVDSNVISTAKGGTLTLRRPITAQRAFGSPYVTWWGLGLRDVSFAFDLFDDDSSAMTDFCGKGISDAVVAASLVIGNIAGNTLQIDLTGLQVVPPSLDDKSGDRWIAKFDNQTASVSNLTLTNEVVMTWK